MTRLSSLLDQIDSGAVLLPEFQRGYVWNRDQVRGLMRSLYLGYPVGGLLVWETGSEEIAVRGSTTGSGLRQLLLDGQQRITTLYGIMRGTAPSFFEGDEIAFTGLHFDVERELFEFQVPGRDTAPAWIDITELFAQGPMHYLSRFPDESPETLALYLDRLNKVREVANREFNVETITGSDRTVDEVVDIFNRVNSGGTKLSKGDLALATLCAQWPQARGNLRDHLIRWDKDGYTFTLDWLLRNVIAVGNGRAHFDALGDLAPAEFEQALVDTTEQVDTFLDTVAGRLGLDHDRVLMGRYAIPVITRLLFLNGGRFDNDLHRDRVLYWYVHSALWGRFSGSTETFLQQDYDTLERGGIDALIGSLERLRGGSLDLCADDFAGATRGSRFYPLLYMLTRVDGSRDLGSGSELGIEQFGERTPVQVHYLFPKTLLRDAGYERNEINAIANFCFLSPGSEAEFGEREPADYFAEMERRNPGALASQWIPTDPSLWRVENYREFLRARRKLLSASADAFLEKLRTGKLHRPTLLTVGVAGVTVGDPAVDQVNALVDDLIADGFGFPLLDSEVSDPVTGRELAVAEAFWPEGLQPGVGMPVVLVLEPSNADLTRFAQLGYAVFTSVDALRGYVDNLRVEASGDTSVDGPVGDLAALADRLPATWVGNSEQVWFRFAWNQLEHDRADGPDSLLGAEQLALRYIALWALTRTFYIHAFDQGNPGEWRYYLGDAIGPSPLVPRAWLAQRAVESGALAPGMPPGDEDIAIALVHGVIETVEEVATALAHILGGPGLFASLWASAGAAEHYGYPLSNDQINDLINQVVNDPESRKIQAYNWIEAGLPL
ncbi:GmrSD restriction endonuclease domain-containing protein [Nocardia salmonicida]|uniref:GmrSD restriction endonuclease domain-containing protein n=1 Tax=Nocardia salmonicida TaxID=53431 RepID=UPI00379C1C88